MSNYYADIPNDIVEKLMNLPESGMGYQILTVEQNDGIIYENVIVTNCSIYDKEICPVDWTQVKSIKLSEEGSIR